MMYKVCPICGANLDPWEHCDCEMQHSASQESDHADRDKEEKEKQNIKGPEAMPGT